MSYNITIFGIDITVNPIAFTIPIGESSWDIYWYGILIAVGFLLALIYSMKNSKRFGLINDKILNIVLVTAPVAILCARAYYIFFDPDTSFADFIDFSNFSGFSGLAIYGGVIGAFLCGFVVCKIEKVNIFDMFDLTAICFLIGQCIGRWGNFFNQEAFGGFTGSDWWGMQSERTIYTMGAEGMVHPCFLYESIWCLIGFFLLHHVSKKRLFRGQILLMYGAWYGFGRCFIELLRTDSLYIGTLRVSHLLSVIVCVISTAILIFFSKRNKRVRHKEKTGVAD